MNLCFRASGIGPNLVLVFVFRLCTFTKNGEKNRVILILRASGISPNLILAFLGGYVTMYSSLLSRVGS